MISKTYKIDLDKIKNTRIQKKLTLVDMANKLGYKSLNGYYYLETGRCKITLENALKIADTLDLSLDDIFFKE